MSNNCLPILLFVCSKHEAAKLACPKDIWRAPNILSHSDRLTASLLQLAIVWAPTSWANVTVAITEKSISPAGEDLTYELLVWQRDDQVPRVVADLVPELEDASITFAAGHELLSLSQPGAKDSSFNASQGAWRHAVRQHPEVLARDQFRRETFVCLASALAQSQEVMLTFRERGSLLDSVRHDSDQAKSESFE